MNLHDAITRYVDHKRALGMRFKAEGFILRALCRALGDVDLPQVRAESIVAFLNGRRPDLITANWHKKYSVISGFYRFTLARGLALTSPLPRHVPQRTVPAFVPYIYSQDELKRLLDAVPAGCSGKVSLQADVFRALLLTLYGAGLRLEEALSLTVNDVDLDQAVICIRQTKFYKTRLVPLGMDLTFALALHVGPRGGSGCFDQTDAPFFTLRNGRRVSQSVARRTFVRVRTLAGVQRQDQGSVQPRLHDLRHTAGVHRLIAWYRSGESLHILLPRLVTYLGHVNLAATQHYLTLTPELLNEASKRFERFAFAEPEVGCGAES